MRILLTVLIFSALILLSCAQGPETKLETQAPAILVKETGPGEQEESWQVQWGETLKAARKEGKVTLYTTMQPQVRDALMEAVRDKFGLVLDSVMMRGAEVSQKVLTERRAGLFLGDVYIGGSTTMVTVLKPNGVLDKLEPILFLPEVLDSSLWYSNRLPFLDRDRMIVTTCPAPSGPISVNTNLVKPGEIKSYQDFLNPKWKGKFLLFDPLDPGNGLQWVSVYGGKILGFDFLKEFARQEPVIMKDKRQQADALARGKFAISVALGSTVFQPYVEAGAPVQRINLQEPDYITGASSHMALINNAPHPNAARLFINWFLSKEGQKIFSMAYSRQSAREDIDYSGFELEGKREKDVKYFNAEDEDFLLAKPKFREMAVEIFGHLMK